MRSLVSPCALLARRCKIIPSRLACASTTCKPFHTSLTSSTWGVSGTITSGTVLGEMGTLSAGTISTKMHNISLVNMKHSHIPTIPREIVFLVGAPGAGKGTHATHIGNQRNFTAPTIVVSDLLNTPACRLLKDHGVMVDDEFVFNTLLTELQKPIYRNGVVVDGFPRTATQVNLINQFYAEQCCLSLMNSPCILFVMLHVDETLSIERQLERGQKVAILNQQHIAAGQPALEIRQTDLTFCASKARYQVFDAQSKAMQALSQNFPLIVVEASANIHKVRASIKEKMLSFPCAM